MYITNQRHKQRETRAEPVIPCRATHPVSAQVVAHNAVGGKGASSTLGGQAQQPVLRVQAAILAHLVGSPE